MSKSKTAEKANPTARRYDEDARNKIIAFLKDGNSNRAAKVKFGCTAHFAGKLRTEAGIPATERSVKPAVKKAAIKPVVKAGAKAVAKPAPKKAVAKKAVAADLL